ncbi:hypothetical protein SAMN05444481_112126 [Flavobacterium frigidimaris]|nr:hypothetical protein SAMN05444481_112126 [Flavobacterium frigidimaris]
MFTSYVFNPTHVNELLAYAWVSPEILQMINEREKNM